MLLFGRLLLLLIVLHLLLLPLVPEAAQATSQNDPGRLIKAVKAVVPERENDVLFHQEVISRPLETTTPFGQEEEGLTLPLVQGGVTTCPAGQSFVKFCMDSGMEIFTSGGVTDDNIVYGWLPPSPHGAAGPLSLIAVTNSWIECRWKDNSENGWTPGQVIFSSSLKILFKRLVPKAGLSSPRVLYDVHLDRFIVIAHDISIVDNTVIDYRILLAVSKDDFPMSASDDDWYTRSISPVDKEIYGYISGVAVDKEAFYITLNMYNKDSREYVGSFLWIVHKNNFFTSGGSSKVTFWNMDRTGAPDPNITHVPAVVRSNTGIFGNSAGTYLVAFSGFTDGTNEYVQVVEVTDPLGSPKFRGAKVSVGDIDVNPGILPYAPQLGSQIRIFTGDRVAQNAVWVNHSLWFVGTVKSASGRAEAYWFRLHADKSHWPPTLMDHGPIDGELIDSGGHTYFPSLDVNSKNVAAIGFSASSPDIYVGAYATIRCGPDPPGTVRPPDAVKAGLGRYNIQSGDVNEWGRYSGTSLDPSDDDCFWVFNAYTGEQNFTTADGQFGEWKTAWAKVCTPPIQPITNGSEISHLYAAKDQKLVFKSKETVQAGQRFTCALQVPKGDADLYIKFGSIPSGKGQDNCDCASQTKGPYDEECTTDPANTTTTAYIVVVGAQEESPNMGLLCFINAIHCKTQGQKCKKTSECCGTMICDGSVETQKKCKPCKRPNPCDPAKSSCKQQLCTRTAQCCRGHVCSAAQRRCTRNR